MKHENAPCKDCTGRKSGCHSDCKRYEKFKQDIEDFHKWQKEGHDADAVVRYQRKAIAMTYKAKGNGK